MSNKQNEIDLLINSFLNTLKSTEQIEELLIEYMKNYPKTQKQLKFSLLQALSSIVDKYIQQIKNPQKNLSQIYLENLFFPSFRDKINIKSSYFKEEDRILIEIGIKIATQNTEWMDLILNSAIKMLSENSQEQQFENPDKINYQITASSNIINKILNFFLNSKKNPLSLIPNLTLQKIEGFESIIFEEAMKFVNLSNSKAQIIVFQLIIAHFITQNLFKDKITQILDSVITSENKHTQECAVNLISVAFDIYFTCDSSERDEKFLKLNESVILSHPNAFARKKCLKIHQKFVQLRMEHLDSKEYLSWNEEQWKIYFFLLQNIESSSIYILNEYWNRITLLFNPNYYSLRKEKPEQKIPENSPETIKLILLLFGRGFKTDKTKSFTVYLFLTSFNTGINSPDIDNFILQEVIPNLIDKLILKKKKAEIKQVILNFLLSFYQNNIRKRNTQEQQAFLLKFLNEIIQKLDSPKILDVYFDFFISIDKIDLLDTEFAIKFCRFADAIEWLPNHLQSQMSIKYLKSFLHLVKLETLDFNCFSLFLESLSKVSTQFSKNKQAGQIIYKWIQENDSKIQQHSWIYSAISHQIHHFIQNQIPFHEQNYLVQRISRAIQFVSEQNLLLILDNFGKYLGKENKSSEKILANYDQSLRIVQIFNVLMPFFLVNNQQKTQLANYLSFFSDNYNLFIEDIFTNKDQNQAAQHCEIITNFITNLSSFYQNEEQLKQDIFQFSQKTLELVILKAKEFSSKSSFEIINLLHSLIHSSNNIPALLNYNSKDLSEEIFSILIDLMPINLPKLKFTNAYNQFSKMKSELLVIFLNISQTSKFRNQELTKISKDIHELLDEVSDRESLNSLIQCLSEIWAYNAEEFMKNENENENLIENIKRIFDHGLEKSQELKNLRPFSFFIFQPKYFKYSIMQPVLKSYFELIHKKTLQMKGFANSLATTFLNALLQIEDDSITTQFIPEIIQIIFFADVTRKKQRNPFRFMEKQYSRKEPMDENCTDKLRFIMETTNKEYVMGLLAIFTMKKCSKAKQNEKSQKFIDSFLQELFIAFHKVGSIDKNRRTKKDGMINRNKIRILQIANLLFPQTSDKIRNECLKEFWLVSQERNIVPIRKMVDIFGMQLFMRYSNEFITEEHFWDPLFDQLLTLKSEFGLSSLFIMYQLYQKIEGDPKRIFIEKFYRFLLACLTTTNTGVKKVAQFIMKELLDKAEIQVSGMETLNKYFEKSRDACLNIEQVKSHLSQFNLDSSLSELFEEALKDTDLSFDPSYAIVPLDILQQISQILLGKEDEITSRIQDELELKLNQKSKINLKENSKEKIKKDAKEELNENSKEKTKKDAKVELNENSKENLTTNYLQQKISPWEQISSEFINLEIEERRKNYETRKKQNIIVCGSLLARTPNLGGLTRTCEIFNAEMLTINDMQVTKDPEFQKISVGAERWISIKEVKMESLPQFFQQKRQEGFVIIGLEQTNDSKLLSDFEFPQKVVIVVGHEKEGIPSSLMDLMDLCLEIPQFGVIRSLNAHVSTSIAIWEFTNQSLKRTQNNLN